MSIFLVHMDIDETWGGFIEYTVLGRNLPVCFMQNLSVSSL